MTHRDGPSTTILFLLGLTMLAGLVLRTWNVQFDSGISSHPDERSTACFIAPLITWPQNWRADTAAGWNVGPEVGQSRQSPIAVLRDPQRSPLNPLWNQNEQRRTGFTYGHFPLYLGIGLGEVLHRVAPLLDILPVPERMVTLASEANQPCAGVTVAGRLLIALLDTLTIGFLFLLGWRVYSAGAGLLAAVFYTFTAQAIQLSHFWAMDPASTTFTVLAVLGGVMMVQDRTWRAALLTGVAMGLAVSSKFSALPILAVPVVAAAIVLWQERGGDDRQLPIANRPYTDGRAAVKVLISVPLAMMVGFIAFFLTSPYAILDWDTFVQATLVEQGAMVRGIADFPFTRQYRNTTPYLYFISQQVQWGMWWPLGVVALLGTVWAGLRALTGRALAAELISWAWLLPYFGLTGAFLAKFNRYMSPVLPFVLLFAAGLIWSLWGRSVRRLLPILATILAAVGILGGAFWSLAYVNGVYNTEHTWIAASRWVYDNAPDGSVILWEVWDDPLPKSIPGEQGMDMANHNLRHIDWSPYEEDTEQKYQLLQQRLQQADYIIYASKRIYDSVDELPRRYPLTNRYYELMFDEQLGFRLARQVTTPPQLFGIEFPDAAADESWSLYDHPQVSIFEKERQLTVAEFDEILGGSWEGAVAWDRGEPSFMDPFLNALGLGGSEASRGQGLIGGLVSLLADEGVGDSGGSTVDGSRTSLMLDRPLSDLPIVDDYRWNVTASQNAWLAAGWWWLVLFVLGLTAWPLTFVLLRSLRDGGYFFSRAVGWLLAAWMLWILASMGLAHNTVTNAWLTLVLMAVLSSVTLVWRGRELAGFLRERWQLILVGEGLFGLAYILFILLRMANPDLWQPWFGGEKFMEFAFLNGILRSPTFPPVDPHFAGGFINYYYFGIYLVAYLVKLTGIYAEVAFNLAIPTLFALTVVNAFGVAYSAIGGVGDWNDTGGSRGLKGSVDQHKIAWDRSTSSAGPQSPIANRQSSQPDVAEQQWDFSEYQNWGRAERSPVAMLKPPKVSIQNNAEKLDLADSEKSFQIATNHKNQHPISDTQSWVSPERAERHVTSWRYGLGRALLAPFFVALLGNLEGFAQIVRRLRELSQSTFQSAIPGVEGTVHAVAGLWTVLSTDTQMPAYDFWAPSRVIPFTINEFPYWSFTFADLHPHLIGIPFTLLFLGLVLALLRSYATDWRQSWPRGLVMLAGFSLLLGTLASVNLWELPTYYGLGVLAFLMSQFRGQAKVDWPLSIGVALAYFAGAYGLFLPFFRNYVNVGAGGIGLVETPDAPGTWLLIWGFFAFVLVSWLLVTIGASNRGFQRLRERATGVERWLSLARARFYRLPRLMRLHGLLVRWPTTGYMLGLLLVPVLVAASMALLILTEQTVLALCLPFLGTSFLLLWRRGGTADPGSLLVALLAATGFALLAGTQVFYLQDFLRDGDWYRMNTLFKFFVQAWILWGVAAAVAVPRILTGSDWRLKATEQYSYLRPVWITAFCLLLAASLAYPLWGTPARLEQRLPGWQPDFGTLNGMAYMQQGVYYWPDGNNPIRLRYDWEAIRWLLDNVKGNAVIAESATLEYYRAGGSRVASMTGLSGVSGMHESEQRYGDMVQERNSRLAELWRVADQQRTRELLAELNVSLIYFGQLEHHQHPEAAQKFQDMVQRGLLVSIYENEMVIIYGIPDRLGQTSEGTYVAL